MRYETPRKDASVATMLKILALARVWASSEIQILPDKFVLELKGIPAKDKTKTLSDILGRVRVVPAKLSKNLLADLQAVALMASKKAKYLTHIFVASRSGFFEAMGLANSGSFLGVPVETDVTLEEGVVVLALSDVPGASLQAVSLIIKGEPHDGE